MSMTTVKVPIIRRPRLSSLQRTNVGGIAIPITEPSDDRRCDTPRTYVRGFLQHEEMLFFIHLLFLRGGVGVVRILR